MQYAASLVNKYPTVNYALLGDDIVIADKDIAESYQEIIESLGVDISLAKSHVSHDTFEFAKRWFHKGTEITPFPLGSLLESKGKYTLISETLRDAFRKGLVPVRNQYSIDLADPGFCSSIFLAFGKHPALAEKLSFRLRRMLLLPRHHGEVAGLVLPFLRLIGVKVSCTMRVAMYARIFEVNAALVKARELAIEARGLAKFQVKWFQLLNKEISPLMGGASFQTDPKPGELPLPLFTILDSKIRDVSVLMARFTKPKKEDLMNILYKIPILDFPDLDRIDPSRASHRILGAQARWAKSIAHTWLERERLLYPSEFKSR